MGDVSKEWRMVPVIPTDDMIVAFAEGWYSKKQAYDDPDMLDAYASMLAVAPDAPEDTQVARIAELERKLEKAEQIINRECQAAAAYRMQAAGLEQQVNVLRATESQDLSKLRAELEACRKDAERYRWLRGRPLDGSDPFWIQVSDDDEFGVCRWGLGGDDPDGCDQSIDAAMKEGSV